MVIGALDTDSAALKTRLEVQERLSSFDLNAWIFSHFPSEAGQQWLDIGCGTGKQTIALAKGDCTVTAVDASQQSLNALLETAEREGVADRIETIHCDMDSFVLGGSFDRAIASYSLYYAADPAGLFAKLSRLLRPQGALFFCGPAHANNCELRELIAGVTGDASVLDPTEPSRFMEETAPALAREHFSTIERFTFENYVVFNSPADLIAYWSSHNLHDAAFDEAFSRAAGELSMPFVNRKRGIGIRAAL
jgi:ubiquinone/menaquinone biosynthesis C-methylase UbiE